MESLLGWLKLPRNVAWPIIIVSGLLLWGPEPFASGLGLDLFLEKYRVWIGVAFLFFLATALMPIGPWLAEQTTELIQRHRISKRRQALIESLTPDEKSVLRGFTENNTKAQDLNIQDGVVSRLVSIGFINLASTVSYGGMRGSFTFPTTIPDWLWEELKNNPDYLD